MYDETLMASIRKDFHAVRFDSAADHRREVVSQPFLFGQRVDGHVPALVGAEASYLEGQLPAGEAGPQFVDHFAIGRLDPVGGDAVGDDERVYSLLPHDMLHVSRDRSYLGAKFQSPPVDAVKSHHIVGVPEDHRLVAQAGCPKAVRDLAGRVGGVPLLGKDGGQTTLCRRRRHQL